MLVRTDKRRTNLLSKRTQTIGTIFAAVIIPAQALTLFGLIPAPAFAGLFVLGGVVLYPLFLLGSESDKTTSRRIGGNVNNVCSITKGTN